MPLRVIVREAKAPHDGVSASAALLERSFLRDPPIPTGRNDEQLAARPIHGGRRAGCHDLRGYGVGKAAMPA
jgi:hypothetical protein